jgi:predicted nucleic acid-binding protein
MQRGSLLWLARERMFRPIWSEKIFKEWADCFARKRPSDVGQIKRLQAPLLEHFPDAMTAGTRLEFPDLILPDQNDAHVLSTALIGRADCIVTANLKDFPSSVTQPLNIEAVHPDTFLVNIIDLDPIRAVGAFKEQRASMSSSKPPVAAFLNGLERSGLTQTRQRLAEYEGLL